MRSLLLDISTWDLITDANGDIASAVAPYAVAQDVANSARTFVTESIFNQAVGIPYFQDILGHTPPLRLVQTRLTESALIVPEVVQARTSITSSSDGTIGGQIQIIDTTGEQQNVGT